MQLRLYQNNINTKALQWLKQNQKCCVSSATGSGKTVTFVSLALQLSGNTLILVNREELLRQTLETLEAFGVLAGAITRHVKNISYHQYTVGMVGTVQSRYKRGKFNYDYYDNLIIDECHILDFKKSLEIFSGKVIGFTATPMIYQSITTETDDGKKVVQKIPLSKYYDHLIEGIDIDELIELGFLVPEEAHQMKSFSSAGLEIDQD